MDRYITILTNLLLKVRTHCLPLYNLSRILVHYVGSSKCIKTGTFSLQWYQGANHLELVPQHIVMVIPPRLWKVRCLSVFRVLKLHPPLPRPSSWVSSWLLNGLQPYGCTWLSLEPPWTVARLQSIPDIYGYSCWHVGREKLSFRVHEFSFHLNNSRPTCQQE